MHAVGGRLTTGRIGRDHQGFMTGAAQMFEHPEHRVGDTVDVREKTLGDDSNAHLTMMSAPPCGKVAGRQTAHEDTDKQVPFPNGTAPRRHGEASCEEAICDTGELRSQCWPSWRVR